MSSFFLAENFERAILLNWEIFLESVWIKQSLDWSYIFSIYFQVNRKSLITVQIWFHFLCSISTRHPLESCLLHIILYILINVIIVYYTYTIILVYVSYISLTYVSWYSPQLQSLTFYWPFSYIFSLLLPSPMHPAGISFSFFPAFVAIFILLSSNNNNNNNITEEIHSGKTLSSVPRNHTEFHGIFEIFVKLNRNQILFTIYRLI